MTLTEVMVSVAIMGVLATLGTQTFSSYSERAKYAASQATMTSIVSSVTALRVAEFKLLSQLTGSICTYCDLGYAQNAGNMNGRPAAANRAWALLGFARDPVDGWGRLIIMDENEMEHGKADCRHDMLWTAGPDGKWEGYSDEPQDRGDDRRMLIPYYKQSAVNGCRN